MQEDRSVVIKDGKMTVGKDLPQVKRDMILVMPGVKLPVVKMKVVVNDEEQKPNLNGEVQRANYQVNTTGKRAILDGVAGKPGVVDESVTVKSTSEGVTLSGSSEDIFEQLKSMGYSR